MRNAIIKLLGGRTVSEYDLVWGWYCRVEEHNQNLRDGYENLLDRLDKVNEQ